MSEENPCNNVPGSPEDATRSPIMVMEETINTINDDDDLAILARNEPITVQTSSIQGDGVHIESGVCGPTEVAFSPELILIDNEDQPEEVHPREAEPTVEVLYPPSPTAWNIIENYQVLSPVVQNVTTDMDIPYNPHLLDGRETVAEPIEEENDEIILLYIERGRPQTVESPAPDAPITADIYHTAPIILIDLTQDEDQEDTVIHQTQPAVVVIDLTQEEVSPEPLAQNSVPIINIEQSDEPQDVPPVMETLLPAADPSLEASDQAPSSSTATDNSSPPVETIAHLQIPTLSSRGSKRSNSSDNIHTSKKKQTAGKVKQFRLSIP